MRHLAWALMAVACATPGCGRRSIGDVPDEPRDPYGSTDTEFTVDPSIYENPRTSELGTERTRGIAKTIEWQKSGTELGTTYCGGVAVVDKVLRDDAENFYSVRVRLENRRNEKHHLQWRIQFYNAKGEPLIGFNHNEVDEPTWKAIVLDPLGFSTVTDSCRLKGAVGFRLFVRKAGSNDVGLPDGFGKGRP